MEKKKRNYGRTLGWVFIVMSGMNLLSFFSKLAAGIEEMIFVQINNFMIFGLLGAFLLYRANKKNANRKSERNGNKRSSGEMR